MDVYEQKSASNLNTFTTRQAVEKSLSLAFRQMACMAQFPAHWQQDVFVGLD